MRLFALIATAFTLVACDSPGSSGTETPDEPVCTVVESKAGTVERCV